MDVHASLLVRTGPILDLVLDLDLDLVLDLVLDLDQVPIVGR
jgi:hypothetical protein